MRWSRCDVTVLLELNARDPDDLDEEEWRDHLRQQMDYTHVLGNFVLNKTEAWLADVRNHKVKVKCRFAKVTNAITFRILYAEQFCQETSEFHQAQDLIKRWGVFELPRASEMKFILAYEGKQEFSANGYKMTNSVVLEVRITPIGF